MSKQTWLEEFYPVPASKSCATELQSVQHSLQKWKGLTAENLGRHDLKIPPIEVDASSCALCLRHTDKAGNIECGNCVLFSIRNGKACDRNTGKMQSPFGTYHEYKDPRPMLRLLTKAEKLLKKNKSK